MSDTNVTSWQKDLAHTIFSITLSILIFLPLAMIAALFFSWVFSLMSLYPWLANQPEYWFWIILGVFTLIGIGAIMIKIDPLIEVKILHKFSNDKTTLAVSAIGLIIAAVIIYFIIAWFISFLNLNFWLT